MDLKVGDNRQSWFQGIGPDYAAVISRFVSALLNPRAGGVEYAPDDRDCRRGSLACCLILQAAGSSRAYRRRRAPNRV